MLEQLKGLLPVVPGLIDEYMKWDSLIINRRRPVTYRIFRQLADGKRLCLHKFEPCDVHEAFSHPHPWPAAFIILKGRYQMKVGTSINRFSPATHALTLELAAGSAYEITDVNTWHSVIPLETTYTVMLNDAPWPADVAHTEVRTTKGKDLEKMTLNDMRQEMKVYKELINGLQS